jgi:hypothetical protein
MKKLLIILIAFLSLAGCQKLDDTFLYTIHKGEHYADRRPIIKLNEINFSFRIDSTWLHSPEYDVGWSKLIGVTNDSNPHKNSGRLAWRCIDNKIHIAGYFYKNGERSWQEIGIYEAGTTHTGFVHFKNNTFTLGVDGEFVMLGGYDKDHKGYLCHPYFGGTKPAPHTMYFYFEFF